MGKRGLYCPVLFFGHEAMMELFGIVFIGAVGCLFAFSLFRDGRIANKKRNMFKLALARHFEGTWTSGSLEVPWSDRSAKITLGNVNRQVNPGSWVLFEKSFGTGFW